MADIERLNKLMQEMKNELFGKPEKHYRGSTRNAKQRTGRYWVYGYQNDDPIAKVCQSCRSNENLMEERFGKPVNDFYVANRRNKDKCDICGNI